MAANKRIVILEQEVARLAAQNKRERAIQEARVRTYRAGIAGAERQRALMGDAWANATIAHYTARLRALGVEP